MTETRPQDTPDRAALFRHAHTLRRIAETMEQYDAQTVRARGVREAADALEIVARCSATPVRAVPSEAAWQHGVSCPKAGHKNPTGGYLHAEDDDEPYDVDGVRYCGRCHEALQGVDFPHGGEPSESALERLAQIVCETRRQIQGEHATPEKVTGEEVAARGYCSICYTHALWMARRGVHGGEREAPSLTDTQIDAACERLVDELDDGSLRLSTVDDRATMSLALWNTLIERAALARAPGGTDG